MRHQAPLSSCKQLFPALLLLPSCCSQQIQREKSNLLGYKRHPLQNQRGLEGTTSEICICGTVALEWLVWVINQSINQWQRPKSWILGWLGCLLGSQTFWRCCLKLLALRCVFNSPSALQPQPIPISCSSSHPCRQGWMWSLGLFPQAAVLAAGFCGTSAKSWWKSQGRGSPRAQVPLKLHFPLLFVLPSSSRAGEASLSSAGGCRYPKPLPRGCVQVPSFFSPFLSLRLHNNLFFFCWTEQMRDFPSGSCSQGGSATDQGQFLVHLVPARGSKWPGGNPWFNNTTHLLHSQSFSLFFCCCLCGFCELISLVLC